MKFCSHLNVCSVLSLLLEHCRVETFLGTLENTVPCLFSCGSWMACACPQELGHSPGTAANGVDTCLVGAEVLGLEPCWGDECAPGRADHFESHHSICEDAGFSSIAGSHHLPAAMLALVRRSCSSSLDPSLCSLLVPRLSAGLALAPPMAVR